MTTAAVTNTFLAGNTAVAADVNQNFTDLVAVMNAIDNSNIAAAAGIDVLKLAAPYSALVINGTTGAAAYTVPVSAADPTGRVQKVQLALPRGRPHAITGIDVWYSAISLGGQTITLTFTLGSTTLGAAGVSLTAALANTHITVPSTMGTSDVYATPLLPGVADGDLLTVTIAANGGAPTVTALCWTIYMKAMLTA